ncbi:MAG: hypothetical protein U0790_09660 [Isosphaeraceae bacterium]
MGHSAALSLVADPSELRAVRLGAEGRDGTAACRVQLRWTWAKDAPATRLVARLGSPPAGSDDPASIAATVGREEYDRLGSWTMSLPAAAPAGPGEFEIEPSSPDSEPGPNQGHWYVRAYSISDSNGDLLISPGLDPTASTSVPGPHPEVEVSYALSARGCPAGPGP